MKLLKTGLRLGAAIISLIIVYGVATLISEVVQTKKSDYNSEYFVVIDDIKISENRATPSFLINDEWEYLDGYGRLIISFVQVGDSIAKAKGDNVMVIYRKNESGKYTIIKEVDCN